MTLTIFNPFMPTFLSLKEFLRHPRHHHTPRPSLFNFKVHWGWAWACKEKIFWLISHCWSQQSPNVSNDEQTNLHLKDPTFLHGMVIAWLAQWFHDQPGCKEYSAIKIRNVHYIKYIGFKMATSPRSMIGATC